MCKFCMFRFSRYSTHARRHVIKHYTACDGTPSGRRKLATPSGRPPPASPTPATRERKEGKVAFRCRRCGRGFTKKENHQYEGHMRHCKGNGKRQSDSDDAGAKRRKTGVEQPAATQTLSNGVSGATDGKEDSPFRGRFDLRDMTEEEAAEAVAAYRECHRQGRSYSCQSCNTRCATLHRLRYHFCQAHCAAAMEEMCAAADAGKAIRDSSGRKGANARRKKGAEWICPDCDFRTGVASSKHVHMGVGHEKMRQVLPRSLGDFFFGGQGEKVAFKTAQKYKRGC